MSAAADLPGPSERPSGAFGTSPSAAPPPSVRQRVSDALRALVRDPNPILLKELRATLRTPFFVRFLTVVVALVAIAVLAGSSLVTEGLSSPAEIGRITYHIFFSALFFVLLFAAPGQAASAFTLEKETKTWESLLLSGMSPSRIVVGKFLALFASILLVVVAVAPVVGVSFLFGGVSPIAVLLAFAWLLGALAVAVSFGVAVSVRVESTRVAVALTTLAFVPLAFFGSGTVIAFGEPAQRAWGTPFDGPFWFGSAFAERIDAPDAWLLLVLLPAFVVATLVWLNLAGAIAGVKAPGVDRSSGLKAWALFASAGTVIAVVGATLLFSDAEDAGAASVLFNGFALSTVFLVIALVFANEPPLPPRLGAPERGPARWLWSAFGPGAGPTLRFTVLLLAVAISAACLGTCLPRRLRFPASSDQDAADLAMLALATGGTAVLAALASLAAWLRSVLRSGGAARILALVAFAGLGFATLLVVSVFDPFALEHADDHLPPLLGLGPLGPFFAAVRFVEDGRRLGKDELGAILLAPILYGVTSLGLWLLVEARSRSVAHLVDDHRRRLLARLEPPRVAPAPTAPSEPAPSEPALPSGSSDSPP